MDISLLGTTAQAEESYMSPLVVDTAVAEVEAAAVMAIAITAASLWHRLLLTMGNIDLLLGRDITDITPDYPSANASAASSALLRANQA
ncbi:hypothetical protein HGRIS_009792 [Hohenbuehelia grisea]|uniref:Uncharacterized protein n=1 Tax=Hohenbuehelia grisea TaxID=104357 RepID=A0ABR3J2E5_9AGAR